jgi:type IV fimbrial biogenesis protein FimT
MGNHQLTRLSNRSQGFTLIELMFTVAIVGFVAVIAAPSLQNFVLNNRIRAQTAALTTSLAFARTEAITRSTRVVTCPGTLDGDSNTCECGGEKWESGWLVFVHTVDTDGNEICGFDELLEVHGPLDSSGTTLRGIVNVTSGGIVNVTSKVSFIYDGSTQPGTFVLCDQRGWGSDARAIEVLATGHTRNLIATESSQISSCTHE